ncbi:hypothetical protein PTKIN_Ptkin08bG0142500 [Pterospermum kingtungense]
MRIDWIPGTSNIFLKDFPTLMRTTDPSDMALNYAITTVEELKKSSAIIFNTFDEFDKELLEIIAADSPDVYATVPLASLTRHIPQIQCDSLINSSLWKEDASCIEWLNKIRIHGGDKGQRIHNKLVPPRKSAITSSSRCFPDTLWVELCIRSTHRGCAFNLLALLADQQTNCRVACNTWDIGMEINPDVKRDEVEAVVKEMMGGENGKRMRQNALEWKKKAKAAISNVGSSLLNFDRIIKEALHHG